MTLTCVEIFAGAGGLAHGVRQAGFKCVWANEMNPAASATFQAAFPGTPFTEGKLVDGTEGPEISGLDLLAGGPPCVGVSQAGLGKGAADERDGWIAYLKAAKRYQPRALLAENVKGLLSPKHRPHFDNILRTMQRLGWTPHYKLINSANWGVPQKRERVLIVAFRDAETAARWTWPEETHSQEALVVAKWISGLYWAEHGLPFGMTSILIDGNNTSHQLAGRLAMGSVDNPSPVIAGGSNHQGGHPTSLVGSVVNRGAPSKSELRILRLLESEDAETVRRSKLLRWNTVRDCLTTLARERERLGLTSDLLHSAGVGAGRVAERRAHQNFIAGRTNVAGQSESRIAPLDEVAPSILSGGTSPSDKAPFIEAVDGVTLAPPKASETRPEWLQKHLPATLDPVAPTVRTGHRDAGTMLPETQDTGISDYVQQRIASGEVDHILKKHPPRRLDDVSSTIESNILRGGYYGTVEMEGTPEGPVKLRRLSALECAALQSFPADWPFQGPKTAVFRQVGNAAPSGMIEPVARQIAALLNDEI